MAKNKRRYRAGPGIYRRDNRLPSSSARKRSLPKSSEAFAEFDSVRGRVMGGRLQKKNNGDRSEKDVLLNSSDEMMAVKIRNEPYMVFRNEKLNW